MQMQSSARALKKASEFREKIAEERGESDTLKNLTVFQFAFSGFHVSSRKLSARSSRGFLSFTLATLLRANREFLQLRQFSHRILIRGIAGGAAVPRLSSKKYGGVIERKYNGASSKGCAHFATESSGDRKFFASRRRDSMRVSRVPRFSVPRIDIYGFNAPGQWWNTDNLFPRAPRATIKRRSPSS